MTNGERVTGTPDEQYDLVSVLYHALQGGETSEEYIEDARSLMELFLLIRRVRMPVISAVRGRALTGGCGLALACDSSSQHLANGDSRVLPRPVLLLVQSSASSAHESPVIAPIVVTRH